MLPSPGLQASIKEIISINEIRQRKLLEIKTSDGKGFPNFRVYNTVHTKMNRHRKRCIRKRSGNIVAEVFKYRQTFKTVWKVVLN